MTKYEQLSMLTPEQARDEAIERVGFSHDAWIERVAIPAIRAIIAVRAYFTTDHVWVAVGVWPPPERRAMGAAMMRAKKLGLIYPTSQYEKSGRVECHARPIRVWGRREPWAP